VAKENPVFGDGKKDLVVLEGWVRQMGQVFKKM